MEDFKDKNYELRDHVIYDIKTDFRVGVYFENKDVPQIDTLTYTPLSDKVIQILTGNPNFHAEEINPDFDEPESDSWELDESLGVDVVNDDYFDKDDNFDLTKELTEKIKTQVQTTIVEEGIDNHEDSKVVNQSGEKTEEKSGEKTEEKSGEK